MERLIARVLGLERRLEQLLRQLAEQRRQLRGTEQRVRELPFGAGTGAGGAGLGESDAARPVVYALTGGGGVPARATTTLGSATVTLYSVSGATLTLGSTSVTAYNPSTTAVAASTVIGLIERADGSAFDVIVESC